MRGRKPKPTALKLLQGNPGKRPIDANEPQPAVPAGDRAPYAPRFLCDEGKAEWRRIIGYLLEAGLYTEVDRTALAMYCQAFGRWIEAEKQVDERGPICTSDNGNLYQNPWVAIANKRWDQVRKVMAEFGMTPSSRTRVTVAMPEEKDELEQLLARRVSGGRR